MKLVIIINQVFSMRKLVVLFIYLLNYFSNANAQDIDIMRMAESGDPVAQFDLAINYLNSEQTNYIEVLHLLRNSSKNGFADAANILKDLSTPGYNAWGDYSLSPAFDYGILSEESSNLLLDYATNGCKSSTCKGHKGNFLILAHSCFHKKEYSKAIYYYKQALTQIKEGNLGINVEGDFELWTAWMDAFTMIGYCYEHGFGIEKNYKTAIDYYFIGGIYLKKCKYDVSNIKKILQEINNIELTAACLEDENSMLQFYDGLFPSSQGARAFAKPAILCLKLGNYDIANELLYVDLDLGEDWSNGDPIRILWTGEMYYKGLGRSRNYSKAYKYFSFIVNSDRFIGDVNLDYPEIYADACYRLYECYAFGRGTTKDAIMAEKFYKLALRYGSTSAIYDDQKHYEITDN